MDQMKPHGFEVAVQQSLQDSPSSRSQLLRDCFSKCTRFGLRPPDPQVFRSMYPQLQPAVAGAFLDLWKRVLALVESNVQAEFVDICSEHDIDSRLDDVQRLCVQNQSIPEGTSGPDCRSVTEAAQTYARVSAKQAELHYLEQTLEQALKEHSALQDAVQQKAAQVAQVASGITKAATDVQQVYDASTTWFNAVPPPPPPLLDSRARDN